MGSPTTGGKSHPVPARSPQVAAPEARPVATSVANSDRAAELRCACVEDTTPYLDAAGSSADELATEAASPYLAATGGVMGPAGDEGPFPTSPEALDAVNSGIELVIDAIGYLQQRRHDALDALADDTIPAEIPDASSDLVATIAVLGLGAATAGIGGAVGAYIAAEIGDVVVKELLKSAVKDVIDDGLNASVRTAVSASLRGPGMADARQAFFRGPLGPLEEAAVLAGRDLRNPSRKRAMFRLEDPAALLTKLAAGITARGGEAYAQQYRASMLHWLDLLARVDLGTISGHTDMLLTYADDGLPKPLFGAEPRGVLRLQVIGSSPLQDPIVTDAKLAGTNERMLAELAEETPESSGLPVEVDARFLAHPDGLGRTGFAEIGMSEAGTGGVLTDPTAESWLALYANDASSTEGPAPGGAGPGAVRLLDRVVRHRTFRQLVVEVG